ncbi:MAG TPA: GlsB/YeaQ/YmgE family stress response membrane protein [Solirubrobacterales bacterium]
MSEHREISEPGELVYTPRPSWAPAFLAAGIAVMICGIYAQGFMVRGWIYSIIGAIVFLFAFRSLVKGAVHDYFRLPRKQRARGAVLPVETISTPQD